MSQAPVRFTFRRKPLGELSGFDLESGGGRVDGPRALSVREEEKPGDP